MKEEKYDHHCFVCGKGYNWCSSCSLTDKDVWKHIADTKEHYDIHAIFEKLRNGELNESQATTDLANILNGRTVEELDVLPEIMALMRKLIKENETSDVSVAKVDEGTATVVSESPDVTSNDSDSYLSTKKSKKIQK